MATAFEAELPDPLDVSRPELYAEHRWHEPFRRLRSEAPVHYTPDSAFGSYWSVSTYKPIVHVEALPDIFSSSWANGGGISIVDRAPDEKPMPNFIAMDRPKHTDQRRTVAPAFTPSEMVRMSASVRQRTAELLDTLPWDERFDWVDRVSIELTTQMLAILFDFPWEDRRLLTFWSDWVGDVEVRKDPIKNAERTRHLHEMGAYFKRLWEAKAKQPPSPDLISMMLHSNAMNHMDDQEFMGNLGLLIVGGNDTTRNTMSGLVYALDKFPDQRALLESDSAHIPNCVAEAIRRQTPLAHMRRTALVDTELEGQQIRKGDKVILWYISANRDESVFADADRFMVTRENARRHLSFGYGKGGRGGGFALFTLFATFPRPRHDDGGGVDATATALRSFWLKKRWRAQRSWQCWRKDGCPVTPISAFLKGRLKKYSGDIVRGGLVVAGVGNIGVVKRNCIEIHKCSFPAVVRFRTPSSAPPADKGAAFDGGGYPHRYVVSVISVLAKVRPN